MDFLALDVETANADMASICAIGIATFRSGKLDSDWYSLVNPLDEFDPINISIHGITGADVQNASTFEELANDLDRLIYGKIVVTHTHFDRVSLHQAASRSSITLPKCSWLDSARVTRRVWSEFSQSGYGLANVCDKLGYIFEHHNALEDAKAAGHILLAAMEESGLNLDGMLNRVNQPIGPTTSGPAAVVRRDGNPEGALAGEVIVFTGALEIPRREAADLAASIGCAVASGVTKKTTMLVVGDTDIQRLAGHIKSSKHRKAEVLILKGQPIRILRETDFKELLVQE